MDWKKTPACELIKPDMNLNGSGRENLLTAKSEEIHKLSELLDVMVKHFPHPRDYQIPGFPYEYAQTVQYMRISMLTAMLETLKQEQEYLL